MKNRSSGTKWLELVHRGVPELRSDGWRVDIDPTFRRKIIDLAEDAAWLPRFEQRDGDWFDVGIGLDLGGRRIELLPLLRDLLSKRDSPLDGARLDDSDRPTFFVSFAEDGTTLAFPTARLRAIVGTLLELGDPDALACIDNRARGGRGFEGNTHPYRGIEDDAQPSLERSGA